MLFESLRKMKGIQPWPPSSSVPLLSAFLPSIQNAPSPLLVTPIPLMVLIVTLSIFCRKITLCFSLPLALLFFFFYHTLLVFLRKKLSSQLQPSVAINPVSSYPLEKFQKTHVYTFPGSHQSSLLVLFSPTGHLMISFTPSGFEELLALRFISVPEITSDGKCPVAGLKQIAI